MNDTSNESLYHRIGGYDIIAHFVDDLLARLQKDPDLSSYWKGHSNSTLRTERQLIVDYLGEMTGGPVYYCGRGMQEVHDGLNISARDWDIFIKHAQASLDSAEISGKDHDDCMLIVDDVGKVIVETD